MCLPKKRKDKSPIEESQKPYQFPKDIFEAIANNDENALIYFLATGEQNYVLHRVVNNSDLYQCDYISPIAKAIECKSSRMLKLLLENNVKPDKLSMHELTMYKLSMHKFRAYCPLVLLTKRICDLDTKTQDEMRALLLKYGADIHMHGERACRAAIRAGKEEWVKDYLDGGCDVLARCSWNPVVAEGIRFYIGGNKYIRIADGDYKRNCLETAASASDSMRRLIVNHLLKKSDDPNRKSLLIRFLANAPVEQALPSSELPSQALPSQELSSAAELSNDEVRLEDTRENILYSPSDKTPYEDEMQLMPLSLNSNNIEQSNGNCLRKRK